MKRLWSFTPRRTGGEHVCMPKLFLAYKRTARCCLTTTKSGRRPDLLFAGALCPAHRGSGAPDSAMLDIIYVAS